MITLPTVFILGAGASKPYGFPLGSELLISTYTDLQGTTTALWKILQGLGHEPEDVDQFRDAMYSSQLPSVDLFLERRPEYELIGKRAIALAIARCEHPAVLLDREREGAWYTYLFARMMDGARDLSENKAAFVTFNYDRSLECFLHGALHGCGFSDSSIQEQIDGLQIHHVYGSLGPCPIGVEAGLPYSDPTRNKRLNERDRCTIVDRAAQSIHIMNRTSDGSEAVRKNFAAVHALIENANRVVFLGFGFHAENLRRLGPGSIWESQRVVGTALGMRKAEREDAEVHFRRLRPRYSPSVVLRDLSALDFLREEITFRD